MATKTGRPPMFDEPMNSRVSAKVPDSWREKIAEAASARGISESEFIRMCINLGLAASPFGFGSVSLNQTLDAT